MRVIRQENTKCIIMKIIYILSIVTLRANIETTTYLKIGYEL